MGKVRGILDSCIVETRRIDQGVGNRTGTGMEDIYVTRCVMGIVSGLMDGPCGLSFFFHFPLHIAVTIFHFFFLLEGICVSLQNQLGTHIHICKLKLKRVARSTDRKWISTPGPFCYHDSWYHYSIFFLVKACHSQKC